MTKEDILNKHGASSIYNDGHVYDGGTLEIFEAMDEYAKTISISFGKFLGAGSDAQIERLYESFLEHLSTNKQ